MLKNLNTCRDIDCFLMAMAFARIARKAMTMASGLVAGVRRQVFSRIWKIIFIN
jgi:uncharacterized protein (UPF0548 family)